MPDPQIDPATGQPIAPPPVDYGQIDLDALFADPPPQPTPPAPAVPPVSPQATSDQLFLDAGSSKYKTKEEAVKGYAEKDAAIAKLRQYAIEKNGYDPLTGKDVPKPTAPTNEPLSYKRNGKQYVQDLVAALNKGEAGAEAYAKVQEKYFEEIATDMFSPYIPVVRDAAKVRAIDSAAQQDPQFRAFLASEDYSKTLDAFPDIKVSIDQAEADPRFSDRLPAFYKLAHTASLGLKAQEALRNPPPPQPAPGGPAAGFRPTTSSAALTPPPVTSGQPIRQVGEELLQSREGRKQLVEQAKASGVLDFRF